MFLSLLLLPLSGFLSIILLGRFVSKKFILSLNLFSLGLAICVAFNLLLDVLIFNSPALVECGE